MNTRADDMFVIGGDYAGVERRQTNRRGGKKTQMIIHWPTVWLTCLALLIFSTLGFFTVKAMDEPAWRVTLSQPAAAGGVMAGEKLIVIHGVAGECGADGGYIIAEARPLGSMEWRTIKEIKMRPINLEPGGALSTWRIPESFKPGGYQGQITVWCLGARGPLHSQFRFSVLGALRG